MLPWYLTRQRTRTCDLCDSEHASWVPNLGWRCERCVEGMVREDNKEERSC